MTPSKILVVEDESIVALDLQSILNRMGYNVVATAISGEEAIELAATSQPDLVLMDIRLRDSMDGVETAQQLLIQFGIRVIYLTAHADESTLQRAKITEPLGYLVKPFEERELRGTIEMALYKIQVDKLLQMQAARLQRVISTVPEGVALLDSQFRIVLANARAREYLYFLAEASVGDILGALGETPMEQLLQSTDQEIWHQIEIPGTIPRIFETNLSPTQPDKELFNSNASEWVLVIREVTAERLVQQRTQAQDRLAAIGQFAAGIAHDFNNILASIMLVPYMMQKTEPNLSSKSRERLDNLSQQAKHASELIKQILDFSRASTMEMNSVNLVSLLNEVAKMVEPLLPENIFFNLSYLPDEYMVNGDSTRIVQLLMNLILNARDAMPTGGKLDVELARISGEDFHLDRASEHTEWLRIRVSDSGTGIPPDILSRIFEPFFTSKAPDKGTGLGLAQVYGIVQQLEGHISVDSQLGHGTTFSVYFPALCPLSSV